MASGRVIDELLSRTAPAGRRFRRLEDNPADERLRHPSRSLHSAATAGSLFR